MSIFEWPLKTGFTVLHKMNIRAVKHSQLSINQFLESQSTCTLQISQIKLQLSDSEIGSCIVP